MFCSSVAIFLLIGYILLFHFSSTLFPTNPEVTMSKKFCFVLLFLLVTAPLSAATVSLSSLLDEMVDRDALTRFPDPAYICTQASSYDRASTTPNDPGTWFANDDHSQFIREEMNGGRKEWVLMDAEGPGAIVRWWITAPQYKAVFRIYLDGSDTPAIEANIGELVGGEFLVGAPLSADRAKGRNLYLPIPYAKQCKVTVDDMPEQKALYYQINYRTYTGGTAVESFTLDGFRMIEGKIDSVQKMLLAAGDVSEESFVATNVTLRKGESVSLSGKMLAEKAGVLERIVLKIDAEGEELTHALRSTVMSIKFDDKETVWCPLGDFFGSGVGLNPYKSWYTRVEKDGTLISLWWMPYQKSAEVSLINYGDQDVKVIRNAFSSRPYQWDDRSMYFHADWRQDRNMKTRPQRDWNYITVKGRGVFVGDVLSLLNRNSAWWGEGDEKIYVDGETFPSHFGTGTEDYYGYAWCTPAFFDSPFHFQPRAEGPGNYGNTTNARVRLLDGIPFTKDFRFDMEVLHWIGTTVDYAVATFWYGFDDASPVDFQSRNDQIAEAQAVVSHKTPVKVDIPGFTIEKFPTNGYIHWENEDYLIWIWVGQNAKLEFILEAEKDGECKLVAELIKHPRHGIIQFHIDDRKIGEPIDLYDERQVPTGPMEIGVVDLKAGRHTVVVEFVGKNEKATGSYVGIKGLQLVP